MGDARSVVQQVSTAFTLADSNDAADADKRAANGPIYTAAELQAARQAGADEMFEWCCAQICPACANNQPKLVRLVHGSMYQHRDRMCSASWLRHCAARTKEQGR